MEISRILGCLGFEKGKHSVRTEIMAGITTFMTMSYILMVNPAIFSSIEGMPSSAVFSATALAAAIGTLLMAFLAKLPFGLAPGMGLNAFFVYTVCLTMGYPWQFALTAVLIEGLLFVVLTLTNVRSMIIEVLPHNLKIAIGVGIGLFISFIGMMNGKIIVNSDSTLVTMGDLTQSDTLLACMGLIITGVLLVLKVKGAILYGILLTTLVGIPLGVTHLNGFVSEPQSVAPIFCQFQWDQIFTYDMFIVVFTLLFLDMFDTIGTLVGVCTNAKMVRPDGTIPHINRAFMCDALATISGACLGTNTTTTFVESSAGVAEGGRTGLTSLTIGLLFLLSLFFSPIFLAVPSAATAPAIIIVGMMMMKSVKDIDTETVGEFLPAFITIASMPFTGSISDGIMLGVITYVAVNTLAGQWRKIKPALAILALTFLLKIVLL